MQKKLYLCVLSIILFTCVTVHAADPASEALANAATANPVAEKIEAAKPKPQEIAIKKIKEQNPSEESPATKSDFYGKKNRMLGDFLVGPYATAVSLPRPISFGLESKYLDWFGVSAGYGFLPQLTISSVKIKITGYDVRFKIYPFQGAFFIGAGVGSQTFTGSKTETISGVATTATVSQDNSFIAPQIGWNWIWDCGFFMGIDLGVQLSMKRTTTVSTDVTNATVLASAEYTALQADINSQADKIGKTPLPVLTLIKVGYFF